MVLALCLGFSSVGADLGGLRPERERKQGDLLSFMIKRVSVGVTVMYCRFVKLPWSS